MWQERLLAVFLVHSPFIINHLYKITGWTSLFCLCSFSADHRSIREENLRHFGFFISSRIMPGRKIRLTGGSSLIIVGTSLNNNAVSKTMKGNVTVVEQRRSFESRLDWSERVKELTSFLFTCHDHWIASSWIFSWWIIKKNPRTDSPLHLNFFKNSTDDRQTKSSSHWSTNSISQSAKDFAPKGNHLTWLNRWTVLFINRKSLMILEYVWTWRSARRSTSRKSRRER